MITKEYNKIYRNNHKKYYKDYMRKWYLKNRISEIEKTKKRYWLNPELYKKQAEEYRRKKGHISLEDFRKKPHPNFKNSHTCPTCKGYKSRFKYKECYYCSRKKLTQEHNPRWTGGHTHWRKSLYATLEYKQWREAVFKRDNYTCQICFKRGGNLEAHHNKRMIVIIKEFIPNIKDFKGYEIKNRLLDYKPLWDLSNGITLCLDCHKEEKRNDKKIIKLFQKD